MLEDMYAGREQGGAAAAITMPGQEALRRALQNISAADMEPALLELPLHLVAVLLEGLVQVQTVSHVAYDTVCRC